MKRVGMALGLGVVAITEAQDQCMAVARSMPLCAVSAIESAAAGVGCGPTNFSCQCGPSNSLAISTAASSSILKDCGAVTGLAVEATASAVCACAASATPTEASIIGSSRSPSSITLAFLGPVTVASTAALTATPTPPFPTLSTTASATALTLSEVSISGSTTSTSAAQVTGDAVKTVASLGRCLGAFIAIIAAL